MTHTKPKKYPGIRSFNPDYFLFFGRVFPYLCLIEKSQLGFNIQHKTHINTGFGLGHELTTLVGRHKDTYNTDGRRQTQTTTSSCQHSEPSPRQAKALQKPPFLFPRTGTDLP